MCEQHFDKNLGGNRASFSRQWSICKELRKRHGRLADLRRGCQEAASCDNKFIEGTGRQCKLQGWMPSQLGGFAWPIQYIKASEVLLISKCPNWNETSDEEDMFHKLEDVLLDQMLPIAIDIDI